MDSFGMSATGTCQNYHSQNLSSHHFRILVVRHGILWRLNQLPVKWNIQQRYAVGISKLQKVSTASAAQRWFQNSQKKRIHYTSATDSGRNYMTMFNMIVSKWIPSKWLTRLFYIIILWLLETAHIKNYNFYFIIFCFRFYISKIKLYLKDFFLQKI